MIDAVKEEKVKGALLDSFVLSGNLHLINHTHIYVQNVVKTSAGYNYGVGLMGRTAKLVRRFQQYHSAYRQKLYETIAEYVPVPKEVSLAHLIFFQISLHPDIFMVLLKYLKDTKGIYKGRYSGREYFFQGVRK